MSTHACSAWQDTKPTPTPIKIMLTLKSSTDLLRQNLRKFARNGRQRRRKRKLHAKLTRSDIEPMCSSASMRVVLLAKPPSMVKCVKLSVFLVSLLSILSFLPSGINPRLLATLLLLSTARRVQVFLKAWLSMPPPTAMHTTVPIVTAAVTLNRRTGRTHRCINNRVISHLFAFF